MESKIINLKVEKRFDINNDEDVLLLHSCINTALDLLQDYEGKKLSVINGWHTSESRIFNNIVKLLYKTKSKKRKKDKNE